MNPNETASVRYLVDDVQAAVDFYTTHLGFTLNMNAAPAIAQVTRGPMRLLPVRANYLGRPRDPRRFENRRSQPHSF